MFLIPLRKFLCAAPLAGAVLTLGAGLNPLSASAQSAATGSVAAAPDHAHIEEVLKGLNRGHSFGQVAISPDGKRLAWVQGTRENAEIRVASPNDLAKSERVTAAKPNQHCHEGEIAWEPDSKALAFFSDCAAAGDQAD